LAKFEVSKAKLYKKRMVIGLVPEKMIISFFEFYVKNMPFYDKTRKVMNMILENDETSLLNQKQIII